MQILTSHLDHEFPMFPHPNPGFLHQVRQRISVFLGLEQCTFLEF